MMLLLLVWMSFTFVNANDVLFASSPWSPCNSECGNGKSQRVLIYLRDGNPDLVIEKKNCVIQYCHDSGHWDTLQGTCPPLPPWNRPLIYDSSKQTNIYATCHDFEIWNRYPTGSFTLQSIKIYSDGNSWRYPLKLKYMTKESEGKWLDWPVDGNDATAIPQYHRYENPHCCNYFDFNPPLPAIRYKLVPSHCTRYDLFGCRLNEMRYIKMDIESFNVNLGMGSVSSKSFQCEVYTTPNYLQNLHFYEPVKDYTPDDNKDRFVYQLPGQSEGYAAHGLHTKILNFNFDQKYYKDMEEVLTCNEHGGEMYCVGYFQCRGKIEKTTDDTEFGQFTLTGLKIYVTRDINECLRDNHGCGGGGSVCNDLAQTYYCSCAAPLLGDGYTCHQPDEYVLNKLGVYSTIDFMHPIPETYCQALFYATITKQLIICSRYQQGKPSGCLVSMNLGDSWKALHPRIDVVIGEDSTNGVLYAYSTRDKAYAMFDASDSVWYSILPTRYAKARNSTSFNIHKLMVPECTQIDKRHNELRFPLPQSISTIEGRKFSSLDPRIDVVIGEDTTNGVLYAYSTRDKAYAMFDASKSVWYSIRPARYVKARNSTSFNIHKLMVPECTQINKRHNKLRYPFPQSMITIKGNKFSYKLLLLYLNIFIDSKLVV